MVDLFSPLFNHYSFTYFPVCFSTLFFYMCLRRAQHGIPFPVTMPFSSSSAAQQMPLRLAAKGAGKSGWLCRVKCATDAGLEVDTSCCMCSAPWQPRVANSPSSMGEAENGQGATEGKEGSSATAPSSPPNPPLQEYSEVCTYAKGRMCVCACVCALARG